jgi:hypothetical protein
MHPLKLVWQNRRGLWNFHDTWWWCVRFNPGFEVTRPGMFNKHLITSRNIMIAALTLPR